MTLTTISEAAAARSLAQVLDQATDHPIIIERRDGSRSIVLDLDAFEGAWLAHELQADACRQSIGAQASQDLLTGLRHA